MILIGAYGPRHRKAGAGHTLSTPLDYEPRHRADGEPE